MAHFRGRHIDEAAPRDTLPLSLHLGCSGWRSLSAKARVNLAWTPGRHRQGPAVEKSLSVSLVVDHTRW